MVLKVQQRNESLINEIKSTKELQINEKHNYCKILELKNKVEKSH